MLATNLHDQSDLALKCASIIGHLLSINPNISRFEQGLENSSPNDESAARFTSFHNGFNEVSVCVSTLSYSRIDLSVKPPRYMDLSSLVGVVTRSRVGFSSGKVN